MCSTRFIRPISQFFSMESFSGTSYTKKLSSASWTTMFGTIWSMFLWSMMVTKLEVEEQLVNQGCFRIWSAERRSWGSLLNRFLIKHRAFGDRPGGTENCPRRIFQTAHLGRNHGKGIFLPTWYITWHPDSRRLRIGPSTSHLGWEFLGWHMQDSHACL